MKRYSKKHLIVIVDSLRNGGIASSLSQFLNEFDSERFKIDLVLFHWEQSYSSLIPNFVSVVTFNGNLDCVSATSCEAKRRGILYFIRKKILAFFCFLLGSNCVYSMLFRNKSMTSEYDIGISFTNNIGVRSAYFGSNKFLLEKVKAKIKCSWLHVDYEKFHLNHSVNNKEYKKMDYIISVSNAVQRTFLSFIPELENKCKVFYNHLDKEKIRQNSTVLPHDFHPFNESDGLRIISVGRLDKNKNIIDCIEIANSIVKKNVNFKWLILGDGPERKNIEKRIKKYKLSEKCLLLGNKTNPYQFMSQADLFVTTSKTESFGIAVLESQCFKIPALVIEYPASKEIIVDGTNGFIFRSKEDIALKIAYLSSNKPELEKIKRMCRPTIPEDNINEFINSLLSK